MLQGFSTHQISTEGVTIHLATGGNGPPLLLLHGYPQTHHMWHRIAPPLARDYTLVMPDLRGYGDSSKPKSDASHFAYSKRSMALDQVRVMASLGYDAFYVAGHDRGGRVCHRMALDFPKQVQKAAVLDIVPTHKLYTTVNQQLATGYYHWFFLIQPFDLPERLIGADPEYYQRVKLGHWSAGMEGFSDAALAEYIRCFCNPETIHATCEDYRAGASIDLRHDEADMAQKVICPLLVLWGEKGLMERNYDVLETWRERARDVRGRAIDCGHFLAEEAPRKTARELSAFFGQ